MISISISTKRSEKRKPTGERVGEEAGMDVDSRKVVRGRIGLVRCVSGRMLGYPMNLKRRMLPRFLRIGGKWEGGWESGKGDAGRGVCGVGSFNRLRHGRLLYPYSSGHSILVKKQVAAP